MTMEVEATTNSTEVTMAGIVSSPQDIVQQQGKDDVTPVTPTTDPTEGTGGMIIGEHAKLTFNDVENAGEPSRPLDFPPPNVRKGVRVTAFVIHPATSDGQPEKRQVCEGVIHREELDNTRSPCAYWPRRRLQDAIYGSVWACLVLKKHHGKASADAARAAGLEPGDPMAPIVWEVSNNFVAIKMVEWSKVQHNRGRLLEDPIKEIAAMQMVDGSPYVLNSIEALQDNDFLYSVMPYCCDGDLFGIVVQHAEQSDGEGGMTEDVARFWFRQILWGLHHLQANGVCHRDLSLENILVNEDASIVMDFGMCLRVPYNNRNSDGMNNTPQVADVNNGTVRRLIRPQGTCGKHNYMSPEVYRNTDNFDGFAIDLWAAGVILYIMLTGFPPYDHASLTDQRFDLIVNGKLVEQLHNWEIFISDEAGDLLQSMLQLDPRQRLSLYEVQNHPWVTNGPATPPIKHQMPF